MICINIKKIEMFYQASRLPGWQLTAHWSRCPDLLTTAFPSCTELLVENDFKCVAFNILLLWLLNCKQTITFSLLLSLKISVQNESKLIQADISWSKIHRNFNNVISRPKWLLSRPPCNVGWHLYPGVNHLKRASTGETPFAPFLNLASTALGNSWC